MLSSCFNNPSTKHHNSQMLQSLITCIYQTQLFNIPTYLTLTWSKTLFSHTLTIHATKSFSTTISLYPSKFSISRNQPGSKSISIHNHRVKLYWDFTRAEFAHNSAEPISCFYIAIVSNTTVEFFLGEQTGAVRKCPYVDPTLLSRREHIFGHRSYSTTAQFLGSKHEIGIECVGGVLRVKVDGQVCLVVKRLVWKFRGNERITIGGCEVEFYWDVVNWVPGDGRNGGRNGVGVFVFEVGDGGIWPEMVGVEKKLMRKNLSSSSCWSVLQWAEESSDGGRSERSSSTRSCGNGGGFSLLLYAWRSDC